MPLDRDATPRRADLVAERRGDGSVLVDTGTDQVELNAEAAALWSLCDGETRVQEIVEATTALFGGPEDVIRADVVATMDRLKQQGLIT